MQSGNSTHRPLFVSAYVVIVTILCALAVLVPGRTYATVYAHDLFVHLDGAWRVASGQMPNRDFHTPLGLIAYVLPGLGLKLAGTLGLAMPLAMVFFAVLIALPLIHLCQSRLPVWLAVLLSTFLIVLVIAPMNVGETPRFLTFAMYYNRWSWTALTLLFVTFVPRRDASRFGLWADALTIGAMLTIMFHLKMTYCVFGVLYVAAMIVVPRTRVAAALGLAIAAVAVAAIAVALGSTPAYLHDIANAATVSGVVRSGLYALVSMGLQTGRGIVVLGVVAVLAWRRGVGLPEFLAAVFIVLASIVLANQNSQGFELPGLVAAAIVLYCGAPVRPAGDIGGVTGTLTFGLATLALAYSPLVLGAASLAIHAKQALRPPPAPQIDGVVFGDPFTPDVPLPSRAALGRAYGSGSAPVADLAMLRTQITGPGEYGMMLEDGMALLRGNPALGGTVATFDLANPFNALLRRPPPTHDNSWNHLDRTFSEAVHLPGEQQLGTVDVVMVPKDPTLTEGAAALRRVFAPYLAAHFRLAGESSFWRAYVRTDRRA